MPNGPGASGNERFMTETPRSIDATPDLAERGAFSSTLVLFLFGWPFLTILLAAAGLLVHIPVMPLYLAVAWVGAAAGAMRLTGASWKTAAGAGATGLAIALASLLAVLLVVDSSWDANWYHYPAAIALDKGWNPIWHPRLAGFGPEWDPKRYSFWINEMHLPWFEVFPKAKWYLSAIWVGVFQRIESGNFSGPYYVIATFLFVSWLLRDRMARGWRWSLAAAAAVHPTAMAHLTCGYVDGLLASLLTIGAFAFWGMARKNCRVSAVVCAMVLPLAVGVKFTGAVYAALLTLAFLAAYWRRPAFWKTAGAIILFALVIGANPYITNTIRFGSPIYPLLGLRKDYPTADIASYQALPYVQEMSTPTRFVVSLLLCDPASWAAAGKDVTWWRKWSGYRDVGIFWVDLRLGGFGYWFRIGFLLSLVLALIAARDRALWLAGGAFLLGALIHGNSSYARLVPQIAAIPSLLLLGVFLRAGWKVKTLAAVAAAILAANALMVGWGVADAQIKNTALDLGRMINYAEAGPRDADASVFGKGKGVFYITEEHRIRLRLPLRMQPNANTVRPDFPATRHTFAQAPDAASIDLAGFLRSIDGADAIVVCARAGETGEGVLSEWLRARGAKPGGKDGDGYVAVFEKKALKTERNEPRAAPPPTNLGPLRIEAITVPLFEMFRVRIGNRPASLSAHGVNITAVDIATSRIHCAGFAPGAARGVHWTLPLRDIKRNEYLAMLFGFYKPPERRGDATP